MPSVSATARQARVWLQKWRWYERNSLPWNRARIHWEFMRRDAFVRWPVHGNVLEALREGRLEIGPGTLLEPNVWITAPGEARVRIGAGSFLNLGVMLAASGGGHELEEGVPIARAQSLRSAGLATGAACLFGLGLFTTGHVSTTLPAAWVILPGRLVGVGAIALPLLLLGRLRIPRAARS